MSIIQFTLQLNANIRLVGSLTIVVTVWRRRP
jgi:hypothetical protein